MVDISHVARYPDTPVLLKLSYADKAQFRHTHEAWEASMALTAHLSYPGQCEEAFNVYSRIFGGEVTVLKYGDTPMAQEVPAEWREKIVHGTLSFSGCTLAGADVLPEHYRRPQGFSVLVDVKGVDNANRVFSALAHGGSVEMPIQETFWSPAFGMLVDRFGVPWEINGRSSDPAK